MNVRILRRVDRMELFVALGLSAGALLIGLHEAQAQSFNCAKANRTSEFAVCNSETLLVLDEQMAKAHKQQLRTMSNKPDRQAFARLAKDWLKKRNACKSDFACLELRYKERISNLKDG